MASSHRSPYKFKQRKNKSSFTSTAAKAAVSSFSTEKSSNSTPPTNAKTSAPTVKFSENSGRLQRFNVKEKSPVGVLIKRVVDLLREVINPVWLQFSEFVFSSSFSRLHRKLVWLMPLLNRMNNLQKRVISFLAFGQKFHFSSYTLISQLSPNLLTPFQLSNICLHSLKHRMSVTLEQ